MMENISTLLRIEAASYGPCGDYLGEVERLQQLIGGSQCRHDLSREASTNAGSKRMVDHAARLKIVEWFFAVVDHFNWDREAACIATFLFDQALSEQVRGACMRADFDALPSQQDLQLLGTTSLFLATKLYGEIGGDESRKGTTNLVRKRLGVGSFVEFSRRLFTREMIEAAELRLLNTINWRLHPPTALRFIAESMDLYNGKVDDRRLYEAARYFSELAMFDPHLALRTKASQLAFASIVCAMDLIAQQSRRPATTACSTARQVAILDRLGQATGLHESQTHMQATVARLKSLCPVFVRTTRSPPRQIGGLCVQKFERVTGGAPVETESSCCRVAISPLLRKAAANGADHGSGRKAEEKGTIKAALFASNRKRNRHIGERANGEIGKTRSRHLG